jgi:hypothetical protein
VQEFFLGLAGVTEHTTLSAHERRLLLEFLFGVTFQLLGRCVSFTWCCPPVISSITIDQDEFFDLPLQGGE